MLRFFVSRLLVYIQGNLAKLSVMSFGYALVPDCDMIIQLLYEAGLFYEFHDNKQA